LRPNLGAKHFWNMCPQHKIVSNLCAGILRKMARIPENWHSVNNESAFPASESGYRTWKRGGRPHRKRLTDAQMPALIQAIHKEFKGAYGSPRMVRELRLRGFPASNERVERLMQGNGIKAKHKRRFKVTTDSKHNLPIAPNLLERNFTPDAPNRVWTSDITYLWTNGMR